MPQRIDIPGQGVVEFPDGMSDAEIVGAIKRLSAPQRPESAMDAANAVGTGFWRGAVRLAGLPVDTALNVVDLGKAAAGSAYMAATGKTAPEWLEPTDRSRVIGSSDQLLNAVRKAPGGALMVDPQNPAYEGGYLQNAGAALTGVARPNSLLQLGNQLVLGQAGAAASKAAYDATGNPALAIAAGMAPGAAQLGATEAVKRAVRGGEQGRQLMAQRTQDLRNAGVENPTLGLASGNRLLGGVENLLQNTPGAVGIMQNARSQAVEGMEGAANRAASLASPNRGSIDAGRAIQKGASGFKQDFKAQQEALYNRLDQFIESQSPVRVDNTKQTLAELNSDIRGAPELSKQFKNARIGAIENAILKDSGVLPTGASQAIQELVFGKGAQPVGVDLMGRPVYRGGRIGESVQPGAIVIRESLPPMRQDMMGNLVPIQGAESSQVTMRIPSQRIPQYANVPMTRDSFNREVPVPPVVGQRTTLIDPSNRGAFSGVGVPAEAVNTLPFDAVKKTRTLVGNEIADNSLLSDVPRSKWNPLYAALSEDMQRAANAAGPQAENALNRANQFTRAGNERLERIAPIVNRDSPEGSFRALESTLKDNNSTFQAVKKSLPADARGSFAGTIIERLGKAAPGQQDADGSRWSPETFLTNWNRIGPEAQRELLSGIPNANQVKDLVDSVARGASMMRDNSRMWANPSGTGANVAARTVLGAVSAGGAGAAAGLVNPMVPIGAAAGLGGVNLAARALTSRDVRDAMLRRTDIDPELLNTLFLQLQATGAGQLQPGQAR